MTGNGMGKLSGQPRPTTLLLASARSEEEEELCEKLTHRDYDIPETDILLVSDNREVPEAVEDTVDAFGELPNRIYLLLISPTEVRYSSFTVSVDGDEVSFKPGDSRISVFSAKPRDLTGMSLCIEKVVRDHAEESDSSYFSVCYDSLTTLLPYHDTDTVLRLLQTITTSLKNEGAAVHFHLDPDVADERDLAIVRRVFDDEIVCE
jgi:hypothetical protein